MSTDDMIRILDARRARAWDYDWRRDMGTCVCGHERSWHEASDYASSRCYVDGCSCGRYATQLLLDEEARRMIHRGLRRVGKAVRFAAVASVYATSPGIG